LDSLRPDQAVPDHEIATAGDTASILSQSCVKL
jgi:hypothetical protein